MKKVEFSLQEIDAMLDRAVLTQADFDLINQNVSQVFLVNGRVKSLVKAKKIQQKIAFIDWLNFTVRDDSFKTLTPSENDVDVRATLSIILECSKVLDYIFGFGLSVERPNGQFFYERSYEIGNKYGLACHGGQADTLLVSINGTGLAQAKEGWETRLFLFLKSAVLPSITRIDLAHDDFQPQFLTVDNCLKEYMKGAFTNGKRMPSVSQAGNWIQPDGAGRTLYIGKRTNGLFCRVYEKGLQLGSESTPNWVRCEVELKSVDRIIPLDVLLRPHHYFAGSFPIFNSLTQEQTRILTYQHEVKSDIEHRTKWGKRQTGSLIKLLSELGFDDSEIIEKLKSKSLPKPFKQKFLENENPNMHEYLNPAQAINNTVVH